MKVVILDRFCLKKTLRYAFKNDALAIAAYGAFYGDHAWCHKGHNFDVSLLVGDLPVRNNSCAE